MVDLKELRKAFHTFKSGNPFDHGIVDNFLWPDVAEDIEKEFLDYSSNKWYCYKNQIEDKKALNLWAEFPKTTYKLFNYLNSSDFVDFLSVQMGVRLYPDNGLHGGGWHCHGPGGNLNPHLDYSIHPKLGLERKLNIIIYVSKELKPEHGGHLGLWSTNTDGQPGSLIKEIEPRFNRVAFFDTTQSSWHGMSRPLVQPDGIYRKSLAVYYLAEPSEKADPRTKALFAARESQKDDKEVLELIKLRASENTSQTVYRNIP